MSYLLAVSIAFGVLCSFLLLSFVETRTGFRILGAPRKKFDRQVARFTYIATHIDWGGFFAHVMTTTVERVAHDVVHATLLTVRATERWLTRTIRTLRERVAYHNPESEPVEGSQLVATIVRFRKNFKREKPSISTPKGDRVDQ